MSKSTWERIKEQGIQGILRLIVLLCSLALVGCISYDTFVYNNPFYQSQFAMKLQFWVCIFFMADLALEFIYSKRKTRYIITYFLLFIACIPYGTILPKLGITLPRDIGLHAFDTELLCISDCRKLVRRTDIFKDVFNLRHHFVFRTLPRKSRFLCLRN